jgi:hypothetical protein
VPDDALAVAAAVDEELLADVDVAVVDEVVVEAAAAEFVIVVLTDAVAVIVPVPVVVADAALGPAYLVQKPNASLLLAVSSEKR